jgi:uncharacterized protein with HEPN domain
MPSRSSSAALLAILYHIDLINSFVSDRDESSFRDDLRTLYAVIRCLEIISEASRRLSEDAKQRHPSIPWSRIASAGNVYRHDYEDVAARYVWETIRKDLLPLRVAVEAELARSEDTPS